MWLSFTFDAMSTRLVFALAIGFCITAQANPRAAVTGTRAFLSSESVFVTLSASEAQVTAAFTFDFYPLDPELIKNLALSLEVPIWLPERSLENTSVQRFWQLFGPSLFHTLNEETRGPFHDALDFSVTIAAEELTARRFLTYSSHLQRGVLNLHRWVEEKIEFQIFKPDGVGCVMVQVPCRGTMFRGGKTMVVSYRQPLVFTPQGRHFFYLPAFYDLPTWVTTEDTKDYSITLTSAIGGSMQVTNGGQHHTVRPGQSLVLAPVHHQSIRATVLSVEPTGSRQGRDHVSVDK